MNSINNVGGYESQIFVIQTLHWILCLVGIFGNSLVICVFSRPTFKNNSFSFYSRVLCLSDTALLLHLIIHISIDFIDKNYELFSPKFCLTRYFVGYVFGTNSLWLLTIVSIDRLIVIGYPNSQLSIIQKRWFQFTLVFLVFCYSVFVNINVPLNYQFEVIRQENVSKLVCFLAIEAQIQQTFINLVNFLLVSILINNILSVKLIVIVRNSRKKLQKSFKSRDMKFSISSVGLNFASFFIRMSLVIGVVISKHLNLDSYQQDVSFKICLAIATFDHSLNFFINFFLNSIFYKEFLIMIGIKTGQDFSLS